MTTQPEAPHRKTTTMTEHRRARFDNDTKSDSEFYLLATMAGDGTMIERLEAEGQARLVASTQLPIEGTEDPAPWEAMGIKLGEPTDELFRNAELPDGWKLQATDHAMWSDLIDDKGRRRAGVFYKAAFYDRNASVSIARRYSVELDYALAKDCASRASLSQHIVRDCGVDIFRTDVVPRGEGWEARDKIEADQRAQCNAWLDENRPGWRDPVAQWEL